MSYVFIVLFCGILADLFYLITKDPGYVKDGKGTSFKDLYLKGNDEVCTECRILRPPRSRHCYYCGKCVYRYDHHCQWVNNCIGLYNNNFFFAFLAMLVLLILVVDYIAITDFIYPHDEGLVSENTAQPPAAIVMVISTLALYPVSLLFWVQVKNYSADLTSSERLSKNRKKRITSFFLKNCLKMCLNKV
jgi:palmitoyltransferase